MIALVTMAVGIGLAMDSGIIPDGFDGMTSRVPSKMIFQRGSMVPAFGDIGFPLSVGDYGLASYDPDKSPYGWHIIKRLR